MEINVIYMDDIYENCENQSQENIVELKINIIKEKAKTDNRFFFCGDDLLICKGDLRKELGLESLGIEDFISTLYSNYASDCIRIGDLEEDKKPLIDRLAMDMEYNESETMSIIEEAFVKQDYHILTGKLVNSKFKFVIMDRIRKLQDILLLDHSDLEWR